MRQPGSVRNKKGRFSVWRVPNFFLEPRGYFLGGRVRSIDILNRIRSGAGLFLLACLIIGFTSRSGAAMSTTEIAADGTTYQVLSPHAPGVTSLYAGLFGVLGTVIVVPVVGIALTLWARPGARLATLRQMVWPVVAFVSAIGIFLSPLGVIAVANAFHLTTVGGLAGLVINLPLLAVGIIGLFWMFKTIYLSATGLLRSEDAHPLLSIIAAPIVAGWVYAIGITLQFDLAGVPANVALVFGLGGPISISVISVLSWRRLRRIYQPIGQWPLRNGPLRDLPPPAEPLKQSRRSRGES